MGGIWGRQRYEVRVGTRVLLLEDVWERPLKEDLLRSKILSNYWYERTHIVPKIANIAQHRQLVSQDAFSWYCILRIPALIAPQKYGGI